MKTTRKTDMAAVTKRRAPLCLCGARSSLHYLHDLIANMERVRQAEDSEGVHRTRVASRRLRSLLPLFALCLSRKTCERWRKQLRRLTRALGEARDTDVKIACVEHFLEHAASLQERPGGERLLLRLQQQRQALQGSLKEALDRFTARHIPAEIEQTLTQLAYASQAAGADTPGRYVYRKTRKAMWAQLNALQTYAPYVQQPERTDALHAMRIATKRLRYTMEACTSFYPDALEEAVRAARTIQTLLGDIHDCDVWLHDLPQFLQDECDRTLGYFGHVEPFAPLVPGIMALQHDRQQYRMRRYQAFVSFWNEVHAQGVWQRLRQTLEAAERTSVNARANTAEEPEKKP
jgi:CHAD domain-containing protein